MYHYILHNRTEFRCPSVFPILPILQSPSHRLTLSQNLGILRPDGASELVPLQPKSYFVVSNEEG